MKAIDVLVRVNGAKHFASIDMSGQRQLHQNAVHGAIAIEALDKRHQLGLRGGLRQAMVERAHAAVQRHFLLGADIDFARRIVADQNHREPGDEAALLAQSAYFVPDPGAQFRRNGLAVDDLRAHALAAPTIRSSARASAALSPTILTRFTRVAAPATTPTARGATSSVRASSRTSAAFASPPVGAARTRALSTARPSLSRSIPSIPSRPPLGV